MPGDFDDLWPLIADFGHTISPEREVAASSFQALEASADAVVLVARDGEELVGYCLVNRQYTLFANAPVGYVQELMVKPEARRGGVARALMGAAERWCADAGCAYVSVATRRAGDFYRAVGYEESATFFKKTLG